MLTSFYNLICGWLKREPIRLTIVRRYTDASGSYVGELYMLAKYKVGQHWMVRNNMIGVSLDSLPLDCFVANASGGNFKLDTQNDFLVPMSPNTVRVGALEPSDNDKVRHMIAKLPRRLIKLVIENRFIEYVISKENIR